MCITANREIKERQTDRRDLFFDGRYTGWAGTCSVVCADEYTSDGVGRRAGKLRVWDVRLSIWGQPREVNQDADDC